jgi:hypothetical protein
VNKCRRCASPGPSHSIQQGSKYEKRGRAPHLQLGPALTRRTMTGTRGLRYLGAAALLKQRVALVRIEEREGYPLPCGSTRQSERPAGAHPRHEKTDMEAWDDQPRIDERLETNPSSTNASETRNRHRDPRGWTRWQLENAEERPGREAPGGHRMSRMKDMCTYKCLSRAL